MKREAAVEAGLFDETLRRLQDFDFLIRVSEFANCASTDQVLWVKYWDANAISAQDNMIAANVELVRRHPEYLQNRRLPAGARLCAAPVAVAAAQARAIVGGVARDIGNLSNAFGGREAARLAFGRSCGRGPAYRRC